MSTDPFDISLRSVLDDDTPARWRTRDTRAVVNTNVDWLETPEAHIFKVDLPGVAKNEIEVTIEDNRTLRISGEHVTEEVKEVDQAASGTQEAASAPPTPKEPAKECPARQEETPGEAPTGVTAAATDESCQ
ncbi:unnamed protein product [Sphagnum balticum]